MAPAISKPLLSDLVAQIGKVPSSHIRPVGDRPDLANVDNESGAGIPLIDLKKLNGPERRKVVAAIGRACESDSFFMVTNHGGVPAPAGVVEGMLRVDGELFHSHLPESSERLKCYSDDPIKAAEARALLESLGLELERSHMVAVMGRDGAVVDQWPSNPPSSFRQVVGTYATEARALPLRLLEAISECVGYSSSNLPYSSSRTVWGENMHRAIQGCMHKLGRSSPSSCLPIIVNDPSPHGSETESPFSPLFILERNNVKVEVITNEATADEDVSKFDLATIAGTLSLVVPVAINIDELTKTWGPLWKVLCGIFMIMSLMLAFIGLFTASFSSGSRARNLSSHCARMSLVVTSTIVFMLLISSKLGCFGCAAGVVLVLVMLVLTVLWIRSEHEI